MAFLSQSESRSTVNSLIKGLNVLEAFTAERREMTLSEVAAATGLDPGTTFRMLNTLVSAGYVARNPGTKRFRLTLKVADLGFHAIGRTEIRELARPLLRSLVGELSEAASLGVLEGQDILYVERVRAGLARLGVDIRIGTTIPAAATVIGQAILAFLAVEDRERVFGAAHPSGTLARAEPPEALLAALKQVRKDQYALGDSPFTAGIRVLAVPVLDADGYAVAAVSVAAPAARSTHDEFRGRTLLPVQAAARELARALQTGGSIIPAG